METNILAGTYCFNNELMFETNLAEISYAVFCLKKKRECYLSDVDWASKETADTIELTLFFNIGILFDFLCPKTQDMKTGYKKIPCQKKLLIYKKQLKKLAPDTKARKYFIHNLNNTLFSTYTLDSGEEVLSVTASIEGIILTQYHHNFWVCNEVNLRPPSRHENYDWKNILRNINIHDTIILFESLLTLVKGICSEKPFRPARLPEKSSCSASVSPVKNTLPQSSNNNQKSEELEKLVTQLKKELNERDYIIDGLLKYIGNRKNPSSEGFSLPEIKS